jgi:hypothetical protein
MMPDGSSMKKSTCDDIFAKESFKNKSDSGRFHAKKEEGINP